MTLMRIDAMDIQNAEIFEILLDNFPDMIHSIDQTGQIVYANKTAERLLGYTTAELMTMNIRQIYADEVLIALERGFKELKKAGDKTVESKLKAKDGGVIPVEIRSFGIYDDQGRFIRTFSILRDIRKIKDLQNSLVHASRLAAIGELASGVAHDINNPLTVILLSNEMVIRSLTRHPPKEPAHENLLTNSQDVQRAAGSIQKLADHLRSFSRGVIEQYETIDLYNSVDDAIFMCRSKLQAAVANIQNKVPPAQHYVRGSSNQLEQVFVNIISNACDAMQDRPLREITVSIESTSREGGDCWVVNLTDTGGGIPEAIRNDIFQSFFTTKEKGKGTGLGLSISKAIVRDHDGEIRLTSEVGKGTTFGIVIPKVGAP